MNKLILFYITCIFVSGSAAADDTLPEIIVTADYRQAAELDSAASISVISEQVVKSRAAQHIEEILNILPNINYASGSNRARFFQIRGIGERSQFSAPLNSSVGVLIDNIDFSGAGTIATMMDIQQVEVLRGPQGTRYGANALAGLINIKSNDPEDQFRAKFNIGIEDYNGQSYGGIITGPVSDQVQVRLAAEKYSTDGYQKNDFLKIKDSNGRDELSLRGKIAVQPSDSWSINFSAFNVDIDNGYDAFSLDNTRHTLSDQPGQDQQQSFGYAIDSTWQLTKFDLKLLANASDSDTNYSYDEDWTYVGFHPFGYSSTDSYARSRNTQSAEIRLISNDSGRLFFDSTDWTLGLYLLKSEEDLLRQYTFLPTDFSSNYQFDTYAAFMQLDSTLKDSLVLSTGIRIEQRDSRYRDSNSVNFKPADKLWGGQIALKWFLDDTSMLYASIARGYKAGGFNTDGTLDPDLREFDEEYLVEYETGLKTDLPAYNLRLRAAIFLDDRHDQQVKSSIVRVRTDGSAEFIDFIGNAAEGTNKGLELEANWQATDKFTFVASAGLLDAKFDQFINEFGEDLGGRDQAQAPAYMYHIGTDYQSERWFLQVSIDGKDKYYFSDRHAEQSKPYALLNARLGFVTRFGTLSFWGRNLTDKDYYTRAFGSFGNDPRNNYQTEPYYQFGEPQVLGMTFEAEL